MNAFLSENFLLQTKTSQDLYHGYSAKQPIIDYHCHLSPKDIALDRQFKNLTEIWLEGDHYKWRAMRINGIEEEFITGKADDFVKFQKWAETVPYTMRNPLYHWTHMELLRPFGIKKVLKPETAKEIYEECTAMLQTPGFSVREILKKMNVAVICTTDDPTDTLEYHKKIHDDKFEIKVLPAWRPDKAMAVENLEEYNRYLEKLGEVAGINIDNYASLLEALKKRHDYFASMGCTVSDHGLETFHSADFKENEVKLIFLKAKGRKRLDHQEIEMFKSAMLHHFAVMDHEKGWVQQYHIGAIRNNNTQMFRKLGPDTGYDAIGDFDMAQSMVKFFDRLERHNHLTKTIVYNLNPSHNEVIPTILGCFADGKTPGKMQFGSGWWFLDQKNGMENQMTALSNLGLLSRFVGMLTDSRSFLSYPRHEYFRRILCNMLGKDIENGELPVSEIGQIGKMVEDISYNNAKRYFAF
ncbi:MAG: glucuronate isomerase [Bacteroidales bacterium]|nr:glucuronate isomerase [Bacteroidales bacterium]